MTVLLTAVTMRQPFGGAQTRLERLAARPSGAAARSDSSARRACEACVMRSPQAQQIGGERGVLVGREDAESRHAVAGLDVLAVGDEAREVLGVSGSVSAPTERRPPRWVRSGPIVPAAARAAHRVAGAAAGREEQRLPAPLRLARRARGAGSPRARATPRTRPPASRRPRTPSAHAARRSIRRIGRDRRRAARRVSRKRVVRPGIMSTLPPRLGTQKLWITSADLQREVDRRGRPECGSRWRSRSARRRAAHRRRATTIARR